MAALAPYREPTKAENALWWPGFRRPFFFFLQYISYTSKILKLFVRVYIDVLHVCAYSIIYIFICNVYKRRQIHEPTCACVFVVFGAIFLPFLCSVLFIILFKKITGMHITSKCICIKEPFLETFKYLFRKENKNTVLHGSRVPSKRRTPTKTTTSLSLVACQGC